MLKDFLLRFIFENAPIRGEFVRLNQTYETITEQHAYSLPIKKFLGEALSVAGLLSSIIKFDGRVTVQFRGEGKFTMLLAQCDNHFRMRGLVNADKDISEAELQKSLSKGLLVITLDGGLKSRYQGIVPWKGNSFKESIEGYFKDSEQLATKIWLGADGTSASGILLQVIPAEAKDKDPESLDDWQRVIMLADTLSTEELLTENYPVLLNKLFHEDTIRVFPPHKVKFKCGCTKKKTRDAILTLGKEEAESVLAENNHIIVTCEFCNKEYIFDKVDVAKIFADAKQINPIHNLH